MVRALVLRLLPRPALPVVETVLPLRQLPSNQQVFGLAPWLGVVGLGAVWMVQPFDWIQKQLSSPPPEK